MRTNGPLIVEIQRLQAEAVRMRAPADGDQDLVGRDGPLRAVSRRDLERAVSVCNRLRADQRLDAKIGEAPHDWLRQLRVVKRQDLGERLDDRHFRAELGEGHAQLHANVARADQSKRLRDLGQRERVSRRQNVAAKFERRQFHRLRACREDEMLGRDAGLACVGGDRHSLAVDDGRRPKNGAHFGLLEKRADAIGEASDDGILPGDGARVIQLRRPNREPDEIERAGLAKAMRRARRVDQRFRGDAADIETGSAEPVGFDDDRVEAELARADRGDIAARAAADDENLAAKLVHITPR